MAFPSLARVAAEARTTAARFPLPLVAGALVAGLSMALIAGPDRDWMSRLAMVAGLGISGFTALAVVGGRYALPRGLRIGVDLGLVAALGLLFAASRDWSGEFLFLRVTQLALVTHLLVSVGPYLGPERAGFWQYNRILFLRFLLATFYANVLWAGLAVALAAVDKLLGVRVHGEAYAHLAVFLAFVVHPWFFLAGVPRDFEALDRNDAYPLGLKVFTQFVLLPLVLVYHLILTLYLARVVITRTWPSGWIGYLVSSVSAAGVLALLLLHPLRWRSDNRWIDRFSRWFFVALLPALAMVLLAVGKRIGQYGVTERRYFLLVLALWMLGIALGYAISGSRAIRWIPATLAVVALVTWFGPWGAYRTSYRSQTGRLARILAAHRLGEVGRLQRPAGPIPFEDRKQLSSVLEYLADTRGKPAVAKVLGLPPDALEWTPADSMFASNQTAAIAMRRIGLVYVSRWEGSTVADGPRGFWLGPPRAAANATIDIAGLETLSEFTAADTLWIVPGMDSLTVRLWWQRPRLVLLPRGAPPVELDLRAEILAGVPAQGSQGGPRPGPLVISRDTAGFAIRLVLDQVTGTVIGDSVSVTGLNGSLLLGRRR